MTFRLAFASLLLALMPAPLAAQAPGTLISSTPVANAPAGMRAWRIRYWTRSDRDRPIQVTGMVITAAGRHDAHNRPVIAWTHGALGIARRCAPSIGDANFTMIPSLSDVVRRGYTVVAPDYPGLNSDGVHPILVGVSTARSVLDSVRAVGSLRGASAGRRYAVWGESQGGHAALWTGQLAAGYAPELDLVGVAAIVPPTDLARNFAEGSDPNARALLTAYTATSWSRHYGASLAPFGARATQNVVIRLADNNCVEFNRRPRLGTILGILIVQRAMRQADLARQQPWARLMRENSVSPDGVQAPLLVATGSGDTIVAPAVVRDFVRAACSRGRRLRFIDVDGGEHATVARTEAATTLSWIEDRFRGAPVPDDCRSLR